VPVLFGTENQESIMTDILSNHQETIRENYNQFLELKKDEGYTQSQIAVQIGVTQGAISQYKQGITVISMGFISSICEAFGIDHSVFLPKELMQMHSSKAYVARHFYLCHVYTPDKTRTFINRLVKYGITNNPDHRIDEINHTKLNFHHEYAAIYTFDRPAIAAATEGKFKRIDDCKFGEYVDLTLQEAMKLVESAAEGLDAISMMKIKRPKHHTVH
jgi:transcriptional regulator with XRE-family HTH domain